MNRDAYCKDCGFVGEVVTMKRGSGRIELVLWLLTCFGLGLIYSVYRRNPPLGSCANCCSRNIIPADSPIARSLGAPPPPRI